MANKRKKSPKERHPLYNSWGWMKKMTRKFHMDEKWHNSFDKFVEDMGERPSPDHQIHRIDKTKGYNKTNCEWRCKIACSKDRAAYARSFRDKYPDVVKSNNIRRYNLTLGQFEEMKQSQENKCAICGELETSRELSIDHCHKTTKVRGLLCIRCNSAIGFAGDDIKILQKAIEYLERA